MEGFIAIVFTIFGVIVGLLGIALFIYSARTRMVEKRDCTVPANAVVKEIEYDYDFQNHMTDMNGVGVVTAAPRLIVMIDGEEREIFNAAFDSDTDKYKPGDVVPIKYNPDDPNEYYIDNGSSGSIFGMLLGAGMIIGAFFWIKTLWF